MSKHFAQPERFGYKNQVMKKGLQKPWLLLMLLVTTTLIISSCKKNGVGEEKPETAASVKFKLLGRWELTKELTTYYGANGEVISQQDQSGNKPAPVWDFRDNDILYLNDGYREKMFNYQVSVDANGNAKLYIDKVYDLDVYFVGGSGMKFFSERKSTEGNIRRETLELEFKKR
ncbi:hypothetical protein [Pedobacter sp. KLB.chiD]|uniref:hypothetical protein n=1 Tax=Pedobacter sp. KLB.chiD TaxID=3387402 RepID=UPI003999542B